jgi:ribosomal protein S18 acetylase RimI-like enzyme
MANEETPIRPARPDDLEGVLLLWNALMAEHERSDPRIRLADGAVGAYRAYLGFHLGSATSRVLVAERDGRAAAFGLATITRNLPMFLPDRYGYLSDLYVAPALRRRGIGGRIARGLFEWLSAHQVLSVQLQYYDFNESGREFWRALGFLPYYTRMWLDLP